MLHRFIFIFFWLTWFNASCQDLDWVKAVYADTSAIVYRIEFTPEDDVIASINTLGKAYLPDSATNKFQCPYYYNLHLVKFTPEGKILWDIRAKSDSGASLGSFKLDAEGNIFVTGSFINKMWIGGDTFYTDTSAYFIAKLNSSAKLVWLRKSFGLGFEDLQITPNGKIILSAYTKTKFVDLENGKSISQYQTEYFRNYNYTAYSNNGDLLWSKFYGGDSVSFSGFTDWKATDNAIYELSDWGGDLDVETGPGKTIISARDYFIDENYFLTKYNANGEFLWVKILQKDTSTHTGRITRMHFDIDDNENFFLAGIFYGYIDMDFSNKKYFIGQRNSSNWFNGNYFVAKYDSDLVLKWAQGTKNEIESDFTYFDRIRIKVKNNSFYLYGINWFNLDLDFAGNALPNHNQNNFFAEYNMDGKLLTSRCFGITSLYAVDLHTPIYNLNVDAHHNIYICGINYKGYSFDFDPSEDSAFVNDTISKYSSGFIARYQTCKKPIQIIPQYENKDCQETMTTLYAQNDHFPVKWYDENGKLLHEGITYTLPQINNTTIITAEDGCGYKDEFEIDRQIRWPNVRKVYPNPAKDKITVNLEEISDATINVQLINSLGQVIYTASQKVYNGFHDITLPVKDIREGIYFLRIWNDCLKRTEKIVVVKS